MSHPLIDLLQIRVFYVTDGLTHRHNFWINPVDPASITPGHPLSGIEIYLADGTTSTWQDEDADYFDQIQAQLSDEVTLSRYEMWKYLAGSTNGIFIRTDALGGAGDIANPPGLAVEKICTGRTSTGRIMRMTYEEPPGTPATTFAWVEGATPAGGLLTYLLSDDAIVCDREGGRLLAGMNVNVGQNEAIFKKRYRPNN